MLKPLNTETTSSGKTLSGKTLSGKTTKTMGQSYKFLSFLMQFCSISERFRNKFQDNQQQKNELFKTFSEENVAHFASKHFRMTPNVSKTFNVFVFVQLVYFWNHFLSRNVANRSINIEHIINFACKEILADFG